MTHLRTILWNNRDQADMECCTLVQTPSGYQLQGMAVLEEEQVPMRVSYIIACSAQWHTQHVTLQAWLGDHAQRFNLNVDDQQRWLQDGQVLSAFDGLLDVDIGFTPATNTLAIRRMNLEVGASGETTTVWVQFPTLKIIRYPQRYTRLEERLYWFESLDGSGFTAHLRVDEHGLVEDYEGLWTQVVRKP